MNVEKELIIERKRVYGDNFNRISGLWTDYLGVSVSTEDVCNMMALMKSARIEAIEKKLEHTQEEDYFGVNEDYTRLQHAKNDSEDDRDNYLWIANNFAEYRGM
jgi:hypothetical protein